MSLSEAYGGKPNYSILTIAKYKEDIERMTKDDKAFFMSRINIDDNLQLADLMETIKNLPIEKNAPNHNVIVTVPEGIQP